MAPSTPQRGAKNKAAGLFATKTPAFTTQTANPKRLGNACLSNSAHLLRIDRIPVISSLVADAIASRSVPTIAGRGLVPKCRQRRCKNIPIVPVEISPPPDVVNRSPLHAEEVTRVVRGRVLQELQQLQRQRLSIQTISEQTGCARKTIETSGQNR